MWRDATPQLLLHWKVSSRHRAASCGRQCGHRCGRSWCRRGCRRWAWRRGAGGEGGVRHRHEALHARNGPPHLDTSPWASWRIALECLQSEQVVLVHQEAVGPADRRGTVGVQPVIIHHHLAINFEPRPVCRIQLEKPCGRPHNPDVSLPQKRDVGCILLAANCDTETALLWQAWSRHRLQHFTRYTHRASPVGQRTEISVVRPECCCDTRCAAGGLSRGRRRDQENHQHYQLLN
mmetsp:Transcript_10362/g.31195  ORF Transcript_10362/g.31195 Transcript_10362/m.31195 type:complete len:235 (+) Transcript_10362:930-1634(+)